MKYLQITLLSLLCFSLSVFAENKDLHSAVKPVPKSGGWMKRHQSFNQRVAKGNVDLLLIGDSITHGWEGRGKNVWRNSMGSVMRSTSALEEIAPSMSSGDWTTGT